MAPETSRSALVLLAFLFLAAASPQIRAGNVVRDVTSRTGGFNEALGSILDNFIAAPVPGQLITLQVLATSPATQPVPQQAAVAALTLLANPAAADLKTNPQLSQKLASYIGPDNAAKIQKAAGLIQRDPSFIPAFNSLRQVSGFAAAASPAPIDDAALDKLFTGATASRSSFDPEQTWPRPVGDTALERKVVAAKLSIVRPQATVSDLRRVSSGNEMTLVGLEGLRESRRWVGLSLKPIEYGDPSQAHTAINAHIDRLATADLALKDLTATRDDASLSARVAAYVSAVAQLPGSTEGLLQSDNLKHASSAQVRQIVAADNGLLARQAGAASLMMSLPRQALEALSQASDALERVLAGSAISSSDPTTFYKQSWALSKLIARLRQARQARDLLAEMNVKFPAADAAARDALLAPLFDSSVFQSFDKDEQGRWMEGLELLAPRDLAEQAPLLGQLLKVDGVGDLDAAQRAAMVNEMTRRPFPDQAAMVADVSAAGPGALTMLNAADDAAQRPAGNASRAYRDRVSAALAAFDAHMNRVDPPTSDFNVLRGRELQEMTAELTRWEGRVLAVEKADDEAAAAEQDAKKRELGALSDYAEYAAFADELQKLDDKIRAQQDLRNRARAIMEDWKDRKVTDAWRENTGVVWMWHAENREIAEVQAPQVMRQTAEALIELKAERLSMKAAIAKWDAYAKANVKPLDDRYAEIARKRHDKRDEKMGALRRRANHIQRSASDIVTEAFSDSGQGWALKFIETGIWGPYIKNTQRGPSYREQFTSGYQKTLGIVNPLITELQKQAATASADHGMLELDQKREQQKARATVDAAWTRLDQYAANNQLDDLRRRSIQERKVWDAIVSLILQFKRANDGYESFAKYHRFNY